MNFDRAEIDRALHETAGVHAAVQVDRGQVVLSGIVRSGPVPIRHAETDSSGIVVWFETFGSTLAARGGEALRGFEIAGRDGVFHPAEAEIQENGHRVHIWSSRVPEPVAARYAWRNNPSDANLVNAEGLPASPFTVDLREHDD